MVKYKPWIQEMEKVTQLMNKFEYTGPTKWTTPGHFSYLSQLIHHNHPPHYPLFWSVSVKFLPFATESLIDVIRRGTDFRTYPPTSMMSLFSFWVDPHNNSSPYVRTLPLASLPGDSHQSESPWCHWGWPTWPPSGAPEWCPGAERQWSGSEHFHRTTLALPPISTSHPILGGRKVQIRLTANIIHHISSTLRLTFLHILLSMKLVGILQSVTV